MRRFRRYFLLLQIFLGGYGRAMFLKKIYDVTISNNVIIGAGSVVTRNIPNNCIAVGVPCKVIGCFEDYKKRFENR